MRIQKPREIAARVLLRSSSGSQFLEDLLDAELASATLSPADRALTMELVYGVARWRDALDHLINRRTGNRPQKLLLRNLLRLGLYQMFWLSRIPDHAAVNETVQLARELGFGPQAGFVNAVLRTYARQREATRQLLADLQSQQPALGYSHPAWLVDRWTARWGPDLTRQLLAWDNAVPRTFARVNTLVTDAGKLLDRWRQENVEYDFGRWDWLPENLVFEIKSSPPLAALPSFRDGWFYIQDPSTLLAARELDPRPGDTVLDLCAAPGGKTTFMAQCMGNQGRILAGDASEDRLKLLIENAQRLGTKMVEVFKDPTEFLDTAAQLGVRRALVDVPCSNTGVIRRRVDLRWRLRAEELTRLQTTQISLLAQAAQVVGSGGVLVYSTCSLEPEENQEVVESFLRRHPEFHLEASRTILPFKDNADGAYVTRLRRKEGV